MLLFLEGEIGHSGELVRSTATVILLFAEPDTVLLAGTEENEEVALAAAVEGAAAEVVAAALAARATDILCDRFFLVSWSLSSLLLSCIPRRTSLL